MLSTYQLIIAGFYKISIWKMLKNDKEKYVLHSEHLQLYLRLED